MQNYRKLCKKGGENLFSPF